METREWILLCCVTSTISVVFGHWLGWNGRGELEKDIRAKERDLEIKKLELAILEEKAKKSEHSTKPWDCETR